MTAQPVRMSHDMFDRGHSPKAIAMRWFDSPKAAVKADVMSWYVAFVAPSLRTAERVEGFLQRLGVEAYWPKLRHEKKRPVRGTTRRGVKTRYEKVWVTLPVLPRYVLLRLPSKEPPFGLVTSREAQVSGITGLVSNGNGPDREPGMPTVIADSDVAKIRAREAAGEWTLLLPPQAVVGSIVRITDGPFRSFNATVEELLGLDRLRVSVSIFGRASPVDLEADQVEQPAR